MFNIKNYMRSIPTESFNFIGEIAHLEKGYPNSLEDINEQIRIHYKNTNTFPRTGDIGIVNDSGNSRIFTFVDKRWEEIYEHRDSTILDGKEVASFIKNIVKEKVKNRCWRTPKLVIVHVGNDPASEVYMRGKKKDCEECGINCVICSFEETVSFDKIKNTIINYSKLTDVDGIILQLPLPDKFTENEVNELINCIDPEKDVDCFTDINIGKLNAGHPYLSPCTPSGIVALLDYYNIDVDGKSCAIINRSNLVGKPLAAMLTAKNATVTLCHSHTANLKEITRNSDIVVTAVGKENFITDDMVNDDATVIDVSMNRNKDGKLCGDVNHLVYSKVKYITPVPGGVGPMTRAMLMMNTIEASEKRKY